jgi:hypothetical protein
MGGKLKDMKPKLNEVGLLSYLPQEPILEAFDRSPGNEIKSGKFLSPESSAALAANTFGYFIDKPEQLPLLPGTEMMGWPASFVTVEQTAPFPWWPRGQHPWLDAFVETDSHIIGIESKRYEPFRSKSKSSFSEAYWRPVWGEQMGRFEAMRDDISKGKLRFERLDAVQLVKHAFGLRTEARRRNKAACLFYLYAEPSTWPDGRQVDPAKIEQHRRELLDFSNAFEGDEVTFASLPYQELLNNFAAAGSDEMAGHAASIGEIFAP